MTILRRILIAAFALALPACSSNDDLQPGHTGQSFVTRGQTYDQVWNAAMAGIQQSDDERMDLSHAPHITLQDKKSGRIEAETNWTLWSFGELIGVYITPAHDAPEYKIEVESLKKMKTNLFAKNWENTIMSNISNQLHQTPVQK